MHKESLEDDEPRARAAGRKGEAERRDEPSAAEARVKEIVELAARVRHEINNPLTGIIGQAQLLLRDETLGEEARRRVKTIEELAKRIRDTIAELRTVQHVDTGSTDEPPRH